MTLLKFFFIVPFLVLLGCNDSIPLVNPIDTLTVIDTFIEIKRDTIELSIETPKDTIKVHDTIKILISSSNYTSNSSKVSSSSFSSSSMSSSSSSFDVFRSISKDLSSDTLLKYYKDYLQVYKKTLLVKVFLDTLNGIERDTLVDSLGNYSFLRVCDRKNGYAINYYRYLSKFYLYFRYSEDDSYKHFIVYGESEKLERTIDYIKKTDIVVDNSF